MSGAPADDDAAYRWHQLVWRLDDLFRQSADGLPEEEVAAFDAERVALLAEIAAIEERLGAAESARLRHGHEADRAYRRQLDELEAEDSEAGGTS